MSIRRRPRGSLRDPIQVGYQVERSSAERLTELAARHGASKSEFVEFLIHNVPLDERGIAKGWSADRLPEELPLKNTA